MIILGVDLSSSSTGLALVEGGGALRVGHIKPKGKSARDRYEPMMSGLAKALDAYQPDVVGIESIANAARSPHLPTVYGFWWAATMLFHSRGLPWFTVAPKARAKWATDSGSAGKEEVADALRAVIGDVQFANSDESDAAVIALMGAAAVGVPIRGFAGRSLHALKWEREWTGGR